MKWFRVVRRIRRRRPRRKVSEKSRVAYTRHKEAARALVHERLKHLNLSYGYPVRRVFIKNHKSRWGSCSRAGNLNFNYKLVHLPPEIADYVIVHELCHLGEFNHSPAFWALVAREVPDHRLRRRELRSLEQRLL